MNLALRPATVDALRRFRSRRSNLLWLRAFLCIAGLAVGLLVVLALLDRAWFLPDEIRPWASVAAYVGCAIMAWRVALRRIGEARGEMGAARLMEAAEPSLRERLLAAVELSQTGDTDRVPDSPEFRAKLQDEVAATMGGVNWKRALPSRSLRPWWLAMFGAVAVAVALSFIPMLHLPGFIARAALPFANLERPSSVKIRIVRPAPSSTKAPFASEVDLAVDIVGPHPDKVILESGDPSGKAKRVELTNVAGNRYEGTITVGQSDVRYRLRAADAMTAWHLLSARPRPRVVEFAKTIVPPGYTGLKEHTVTEDHGDLEALAGSVVKLSLKTNQSVSKAEVVLNPDETTHPKAPAASTATPTEIKTELAINEATATWQVALTSAETGFTNDESSPWRVVSIPDLPPTAQITEPKEQLELLPDEAVRLAGFATDDVGLASVQLSHAINGADWKDVELASKPGKEAEVKHVLPLGPLGVKAGDTVVLKLVATDLKGQKAESQPVRVVILEQTIDPKQRQWTAAQRRLAQQAKDLAEKAREMRKVMEPVQKNARLEKKNKEPNNADNALARAQEELRHVKEQADDLWQELKKAAQLAPTQLDAQEAQLLGERLAEMRQKAIPEIEKQVQEPVESPESLKRASSEAMAQADTIANAAKTFAAADTAKLAAQAAQQLHRQENLLTETALPANRDATARPKWQEQQRGAIAATESMKKDVAALGEQIDGGQKKNLEQLRDAVTEASHDLSESLDKKDQNKSPEHLYGAADNLRQRLARTADAARAIAEDAANRAAQLRERLQKADNPGLVALEEGKAALHEAAAQAKSPKQKQKPSRDGLTSEERAQQRLAEAARQLQDQAELREQNPLTNDQSALDTNRASRAADKLARNVTEKQSADDLEKARAQATDLAAAARMLDADAKAQSAVKSLAEAAAPEQAMTKKDSAAAAEEARAAAEQLRDLPAALRKVNAPNDLANAAQQAADTARNAAEDLKNQAKQAATLAPNQPHAPMNQQQTNNALQKAADVAQQLASQAQTARDALAQLTPQVSEMMKQVAQDLKKTQGETQTAANDAKENKPVDQVADQAQRLQPKAADNEKRMESLQAALRQEANQANLAQADQRQMARTADVALEQMRQKSPQIAQNLKQAAQATQSQPQAQSLQKAADAQQQTAQALDQLAQNMSKMEQGQELTQQELAAAQQMEKDLQVQEPLDEAYDRAKDLAKLAEEAAQNPEKVLADLEKELPKNPAMQKALADIGKTTAQTAEQQLAEKADQPAMLSMAAKFASHDLARVARHEQRLGQKEAAEQVAKASNDLQQTAANTKTDPSKATQQVTQQAKDNATQAAKAAEQTAAKAPAPATNTALEQTQGAILAQALDQLDQSLHPMESDMPGNQQQQQQGQQSGSQQSQQQAQQSLSNAEKNQQQSMADARNQGKVPGQQKSSPQMADNKKQNQPSQQSKEGGNFDTNLQDGVLGAETVLVNGDWGHLPARMAKDLTEATRQEAAPEYRAAIESYYKAIATKARK
ncbi:MAG: hypothetical protein K1X78_13105 [Verrucomicrobiaceae bacterium]|nr:hypothetical protein [Verrucomicrobiaceae bacterium]